MEQPLNGRREGLHLRLPEDLKEWYRALAEKNAGSMNGEIVRALIAQRAKAEQEEKRARKRT